MIMKNKGHPLDLYPYIFIRKRKGIIGLLESLIYKGFRFRSFLVNIAEFFISLANQPARRYKRPKHDCEKHSTSSRATKYTRVPTRCDFSRCTTNFSSSFFLLLDCLFFLSLDYLFFCLLYSSSSTSSSSTQP